MNRARLFLPAALVLLVTVGCTPPLEVPVIQQPTVAVFAAPRDKVWAALVGVVGLDFPIQVLERDSGLISTRVTTMVPPASRWALGCDNPDDFANPWNQLRMDLRALVEEREPGKTQVTLLCHYEANKQSTFPHAWTIVASNGALERDLLGRMQAKLQPSAK
jgi:hypothetical protein